VSQYRIIRNKPRVESWGHCTHFVDVVHISWTLYTFRGRCTRFVDVALTMKQTKSFRINTLNFGFEFSLISCSNLTCEGRTIAGGGLVEQKLKERL